MTREEAYKLITERVRDKNLVKHMLAAEAIMRALALRFGEDVERWGLAGLLHDLDLPQTAGNPEQHGLTAAKELEETGVDEEILDAIRVHPGFGRPRNTLMAKALFCSDPLTGLIVASALIRPSKKLGETNAKSVLKRFKEKRFAAGANRDDIRACSEIGLDLEEFVSISLSAMQEIHKELGL